MTASAVRRSPEGTARVPLTLLAVSGLRVETSGGAAIVEDVALAVAPGRALGVVGESGSGKTTVALALLGYARPGTRIAAGNVVLGDTELLALAPDRLRALRGAAIAYVPQSPGRSLNPSMRVERQLAEMMEVHLPGSTDGAALEALLERVGLPGDPTFRRRFVHQLSGGQQQRLALAMALSCSAQVLVLDEPTTGLDVVTQRRVLAEIDRLRATTGVGVVLVSHDLATVATIADDVAVMYGGAVVESGPVADVLDNPAHPYTAGLVASVPELAVRRALRGIPGTAVGVADRGPGCPFAPRCELRSEECGRAMPPPTKLGPGWEVRCYHARGARTALRPAVIRTARHETAAPLLSVQELSAAYGRREREVVALRAVSFSLAPGDCLAVVGESGSGKSTIARCVAGLHAPSTGELQLDGERLAPLARHRSKETRRRVQIVFQDPYDTLNPAQTVAAAIGRPLRLFDQASGRVGRRAAVDALLERVRLPARLADRHPSELSGGERQRVAIARALAPSPELLVCDEITSSLDVSVQAAVLELLGGLRRELGLAMLFISHDLGVVASIADDVLVLAAGTVIEEGPVDDVLQRPQAIYTRELIAAAPRLRASALPAELAGERSR